MKFFIEKKNLYYIIKIKDVKEKGKKCDNGNKDNCYFFFNLFIIIIYLFNYFLGENLFF